MVVLGTVLGEGGPFLLVDRVHAEGWQGAADGSTDYDQVYDLGEGGGPIAVSAGVGVAWEAEGAAVVIVARYADDRLLLHRAWADDNDTSQAPTDRDVPASGAVEVGRVEVGGELVILWSPFGWADVTDDSMWEPPPARGFHPLHSPPMANIGMQVPVPAGTYICRSDRPTDDAIRLWVERDVRAQLPE